MVKLRRVNEAKQVGKLYHVCSSRSLIYNLKHNSISPGEWSNTRNGKKCISFTRDPHYVVDTIDKTDPFIFQLVIDGDKLSENKKIEPYADQDYRSREELEKEESVEGSIRDLRKYLIKINLFIDIARFDIMAGDLPSYVLESLQALQSFKMEVEILVVENIKSMKKVRTAIPTNLSDLITYIEKISEYDSNSMYIALSGICSRFFVGHTESAGGEIKVNIKEGVKLSNVRDMINTLVEIIQEQLDSSIIVTEKKEGKGVLSRHSSYKLSTVLNNKTYLFKKMEIYTELDAVYNALPKVELILQNSKGTDLAFVVYYKIL